MKISIACTQCIEDGVSVTDAFSPIEIKDNGRYEITCPNGHSKIIILQQQKFEILFEIGANAIVDGYYREAVSSFTSALERFYEFYIKVICLSKGIEWDTILETWKTTVSNQSERQLGAFVFLHLQEQKQKPVLLSNNKVQFRNEVIHKGKIPTREEAVGYGQAILEAIRAFVSVLKENYQQYVSQVISHHILSARADSDDEETIPTVGVKTIIGLSITITGQDNKDLDACIADLILSRKIINTQK